MNLFHVVLLGLLFQPTEAEKRAEADRLREEEQRRQYLASRTTGDKITDFIGSEAFLWCAAALVAAVLIAAGMKG